jgi:hypothetical protein
MNKIRPSIWMMMAVAVAAVVFAAWHSRHPLSAHLVSVASREQNPASTPVATASRPVPATVLPSVSVPALAQSSPELSAVVKTILDGTGYREREKALQGLTGKLTDADRGALYDFLRQHDSADDRQLGQVLKNDLMNVLCQMEPPPQGLRELLSQIYQDGSQNIVLRDYALQHMAAFYRQMASASGVDDQADELKQAQSTLWGALANTDSSMAGTALLGLSQLSQQGWPGFEQDKISAAALKLAGESTAGELTRITAFQVCASLGNKDALPAVQAAAQQGETIPVQISAIAALGTLGGSEQIPFLNGVLEGNIDRLKLPAQHALGRIEQRLQQPRMASLGVPAGRLAN